MNAGKLYFGGTPVAPDVELLLSGFQELDVGTFIPHERVEETLGLKRTTARYRTVTTSWRERLWDEKNIRIGAVRGKGFEILTPTGRLDLGETRRTRGVRQFVRGVKEVATVGQQDLTVAELHRRDHLLRTSIFALSAVKDAQRDYALALKNTPEPLPKRKLLE